MACVWLILPPQRFQHQLPTHLKGHNFCRSCLSKCWTDTQTCFCPFCKETFSKRPDLKTTIRDVVQHFKEKLNLGESEVFCDVCDERKQKAVKTCLTCPSSYCETHLEPHLRVPRLKKHKLINAVENLEDYICQKHERPLELFCRDDQTCVCVFCTEGEHRTHNTVPIEEESREKKNHLAKRPTDVHQMIQDRMKKIQEIKRSVELRKKCSSLDSRPHSKNWTEIRIDSDVNVNSLHRALIQLKKSHETLKQKLNQTGLKFVQKFAVDVTLDPDTADPYLILSDDGKQVSDGDIKQDVPENPKRFDEDLCVLAKQGFSSGRFYYEVQMKGKTGWSLGVVRESINRKGMIREILSPENGFWILMLVNENQYACDNPLVVLSLGVKPEKVGVFVDYEEGLVSFYDVKSRSHIYSITGQTFTEKLYPVFRPGRNDKGKSSNPLIISPVR